MRFSLGRGGQPVRLGREIGRGGEGSVHSIEGQQSVAKLYLRSPTSRQVSKLQSMVGLARADLLRVAAWPENLIVDESGAVRGFVMRSVVARRDIHELYSPKSRADAFPSCDFRFLIHVAANIARAFAVVHDHGHVIGDVNHGNVLVGPDGTVRLIDCDSFQVVAGGDVFACDVGVALFTAPELCGRTFRGLVRTTNHDCFGLAILIFHLLCMGRHPFAGRYLGTGDMPIERAIAERRFVYGPSASAKGMERPPGTVPLEVMGPEVAITFIQAFDGSAGQMRPTAKRWIQVLDNLRVALRTCARAAWHQYQRDLPSCPWCVVEQRTSVRLFGRSDIKTGPTGATDVGSLWRELSAIPGPGVDPTLPSDQLWTVPVGADVPSRSLTVGRKIASLILCCVGLAACGGLGKHGGVAIGIVSYVIAFVTWPRVPIQQRLEREREYSAAQATWQSVLKRWQQEACESVFVAERERLRQIHTELVHLPRLRSKRLAELASQRERNQLRRYLDRFRIDRARIQSIGPGRTAMLASYGIETAADIDRSRIMQIPGFGAALTSELTQWRRSHEANFVFNATEPVDPGDIAALDAELLGRQLGFITALQGGAGVLRQRAHEIRAARQRLMPLLESSWSAYKLAEVRKQAL